MFYFSKRTDWIVRTPFLLDGWSVLRFQTIKGTYII